MPNTASSQQCLADDVSFRLRTKDALSRVAWEVIEEDPAIPNHDARAAYARTVLQNLDAITTQLASSLVTRTNLFGFETSYDFDARATITAAGDADIQSQLHSDWNVMAGITQ